ncbi:MAG: glutamate synthase large subunit [Chloroflexi bacterium]|jgi:glutamate synthase domain-containing protein 2/glutamate synthase domain-containing protein 1/glutamate synthase domain-containing protein 3|nr:glutamate synthase large subunit [Chloroflexota bacterium]MDP6420615.1 glutamate synthase large subunit [SAR202 cluster bacterium]HAL47631.1 glutamate synthase large subunit [Dehalococcoidia bacterium]MDP6663848.1 glutamate synthase large subunit [SAR202 cluster bacterium]MDP6801055.1 glutamate synthase large subunit [SAR202 cluster bacterium]|tara:strand:- start:5001 stop:9560 length:4560 start_codon:yes stop_codon:yes gene_type:complete
MASSYDKDYTPSVSGGLYDPAFEHDACGVGLVANVKGRKSHSVIQQGIEVLVNLGHRGAAGADPETGDGAGILIQMPHDFLVEEFAKNGVLVPEPGAYGLGMVFMPTDDEQHAECEQIIERVVRAEGQTLLGWRDVPVSPNEIGTLSARVMPSIRQFLIGKSDDVPDQPSFELKLYVIRRLIETAASQAIAERQPHFYVCSLSTNKVVYKGLILAHQLLSFYHDLADERMVTAFALVHSRFSTNTLGSWRLAHPYRMVIHNGEINTLRGNINWMTAREKVFASATLGDDVEKLLPIIGSGQSDTASLDNALELLLATGRSLEHSMMMLIPEAWGDHIPMDQAKRDFYEYHSSMMEPWDGPALVIGADGTKVCAVLDRNGLRPCRYLVTTDDLLVMGSETGVLDVPPEKVLYKERIYPGRMFLLDTERGEIVQDTELKASLASQQPYGEWLAANSVRLDELPAPTSGNGADFDTLVNRQAAFGYSLEDLRMILGSMAVNGAEPTGSMGNDAPLAVLSEKAPVLFNYFKQLFAQVSNPPLDAIREELVTSTRAMIGSEQNLFEETPEHCRQLTITEPVLTDVELEKIRAIGVNGMKAKTLSTLFEPAAPGSLQQALDDLCQEASRAIEDGCSILILSDRGVDSRHAPIPSLLATAGVHHHLIREGTRTKAGLLVESGEPREVAHFALLIGYGAAAVNPYLAFETLADMSRQGAFETPVDYDTAVKNFIKASHKGVVKIMSKMGISTIQSYRGAQIFEAVGLHRDLIDQYFTWTPSRIGGIGLEQIEEESGRRHAFAYPDQAVEGNLRLGVGGQYQWRRDGEYHMWNAATIATLQNAARTNSWDTYRKYADHANDYSQNLCTIRGLLEFKPGDQPISLDEVEPASEIVKRFATGAISLGSISREAHETMGIAMNRINARSNTGEGGEDHRRYTPDANGDSRNSAIKQVASGRFGVTSNYLANAADLQIKMAQGSKPGEGGQLPGHKVDDYIGWVRNSTPGVELISPPPHHDIYSIEDLAQLIHDLKNSNPSARIHVKLVAEAGVGTIAAGVSKGHGDVVLISGDGGGTGASPESSIKHAGLPWELGIAETQQVLVQNDLRGRIVVQADGGVKTGRDVAIACLLGAEEFGMATAPLITMGCIMLRKCHLNTCSVGIATQDPELRAQFTGQPEHVINYFFFVAEELRQIMAELGFNTVNEMVGRVDRLDPSNAIEHWKAKGLDFSNLLTKPDVPDNIATFCCEGQDHGLEKALDNKLIELSADALEHKIDVELDLPINNSNRTVGATLSYDIARRYGEDALPEDTVTIRFEGSAGQSFAAFLASGVTMNVDGDANDYFCKGLSGGKVIIKPPPSSTFVPEENIVIGNTALYGATSGKAFIRGIAGERFCVRNSGAEAVVEGVGDHGCEYMTHGRVVVLGATGRNFAAGMSGGEAYVLDEHGRFADLCNKEMVDLDPLIDVDDVVAVKSLIGDHLRFTGSENARRVLADWPAMQGRFVKVMPRAYKAVLAERRLSEQEAVVASDD